jgi:dCTP deaminase
MILSDQEILEEIARKNIVIEPFRREALGSNSYDVHLGKTLAVYDTDILDAKTASGLKYFDIPEAGFVLMPDNLYLGATKEYTETHRHVPFLEGKSSVGRLGIDIHATAGKGDVGFKNFWTLEISVKMPVRIYAEMPIGQIIYFEIKGAVITPYNVKQSAKYNDVSPLPKESQMWRNFMDR